MQISRSRLYQQVLSTVEKKYFKGMAITYAERSPVIRLTVTGTIAAGICESLKLMVDQAMVVSIR